MREKLEKINRFIQGNPPLTPEGKPEVWDSSTWKENLSAFFPEWKSLFREKSLWDKIKEVKPRGSYVQLLEAVLPYAPDSILAEFLQSKESGERKIAFNILIEDSAQRLTSAFWKALDNDTKSWVVAKLIEKIREKEPLYLRDLDMLLFNPELFLEQLKEKGFPIEAYPNLSLSAVLGVVAFMLSSVYHPLWFKLKTTVEASGDMESLRWIMDYETGIKECLLKLKEILGNISTREVVKDDFSAKQNFNS